MIGFTTLHQVQVTSWATVCLNVLQRAFTISYWDYGWNIPIHNPNIAEIAMMLSLPFCYHSTHVTT